LWRWASPSGRALVEAAGESRTFAELLGGGTETVEAADETERGAKVLEVVEA
jgi:hypothetical protein